MLIRIYLFDLVGMCVYLCFCIVFQLLLEIIEYGEVNGNDGGFNLNK